MIPSSISPSPFNWKPRYSISECLELLGVSRGFFYGRVRTGHYRVVKDGARTFMTHEQLLNAASCVSSEGRLPETPPAIVSQ